MYHSSQPPQQPSHRLSLAKFSHTTTSIGHNGPLNWNHIIGNGDLELIFEKHIIPGASSGRTLLKVLQDHHTWEEIDLNHLIQEASSTNQKPSSAVIVRLPCIAVKYPNGQLLRRFQVKFASERDYYSALSVLSEIQCPFSESNISPAPLGRKLTSSSWNPRFPSMRDIYAANGQGMSTLSGPNSAVFPLQSSIPSSSGPMSNIPRPHSSHFSGNIPTNFTDAISTQNNGIQQHHMPTPLNNCGSSSTISRPSTATAHYDPEAFNKTLPPKRSLPFPTPDAKKPRTGAKGKQSNPPERVHDQPLPSSLPIENQATAPMSNTRAFPLTQTSQPNTSAKPGGSAEDILLPSQSNNNLLTSTDLTAYLSNPVGERAAIIQNWFCNHIQDDEFLQLCQDVEGVWGRFALGKRID